MLLKNFVVNYVNVSESHDVFLWPIGILHNPIIVRRALLTLWAVQLGEYQWAVLPMYHCFLHHLKGGPLSDNIKERRFIGLGRSYGNKAIIIKITILVYMHEHGCLLNI